MTRPCFALPAVLATLALTACGNDSACSCDLIQAESICIEYSALDNPLYRLQLESTCENSLSSLCTTLGGAYEMDVACPTDDLVAECEIEIATYADTKYYYSVGAEPYASTDPDFEEDCGGTVSLY